MCDYSRDNGPGTCESIRVRRERECVEAVFPPLIPNIDVCPQCRSGAPHGTPAVTTQSELVRTLKEAVRCPIYYKNVAVGGLCVGPTQALHRPVELGLLTKHGATAPHGLHQYRIYDRIRGIDEIARVVRTQSASEVTARKRVSVETATARHAEHFRLFPPLPPRLCRVPQPAPQPGVPIAPMSACNIGTQAVDYSNPRA
jgi:hypothetical protein